MRQRSVDHLLFDLVDSGSGIGQHYLRTRGGPPPCRRRVFAANNSVVLFAQLRGNCDNMLDVLQFVRDCGNVRSLHGVCNQVRMDKLSVLVYSRARVLCSVIKSSVYDLRLTSSG